MELPGTKLFFSNVDFSGSNLGVIIFIKAHLNNKNKMNAWHDGSRCHPNHRDQHSKFHPDRTIQELYEATQQKHRLLRQHGYNLQIMWECDWDREVKSNQDLKQFLASYEMVDTLNPRNAFFGGRTNSVRLHHAANEDQGEQIK